MLHVLLALMLTLTTCANAWTPARESYTYDGDGVLVKRSTPTSAAAIQFTEHFTATSSAWTTTAASTWGVNTNDGHATTLRTVGTGNWTTTAARTATVSHGQTARLAFKVSQTSSQAVLALDTGSGSSYHRFGVYENGGKLYQATAASTSGGTSYVNPAVLVDSFAAGVWYILELTVDDAAGDRVSVWRADTPGVRYEARWELPANRTWTFRHWAFAGTTWLDDYQELRPAQAGSNTRIVGKHYEYDSVSATQTKRYYANGALLATRTGTTLRYVQPDHLGSTTTLTDGGGVVMAKERYAAFGERRRTSDTLITDQLYTGQRYNALSGLYHYNSGKSAGRFYDPLLARFVMADPVTPPGSQGLNRYSHTFNNPIKYTDPDGHCPMCVGAAVGAAAGAGIAYGSQVVANISRDGVSGKAFSDVSWSAVGAGAVAGAVGGATFGVGTAVMGTSLAAYTASGAISGAVAGQVGRATENRLEDRPIETGLGNPTDLVKDAAIGGALGGVGYGVSKVASRLLTVDTPYGVAHQELSVEALKLRIEVGGGRPIYRGGRLGISETAEGQFWAPENPLTPGYADRYGVASFSEPEFIVEGTVGRSSRFITRRAPGFGGRAGGDLEVVTSPGAVDIDYFYMP